MARAGHALPQRPQWAGAVCVSVSQPLPIVPSQSPRPALQAATAQAPITHDGVAPGTLHARSQAPQWAMFDCASTQPLPQHVRPAGQGCAALQPVTQTLPEQTLPGGQCASVTHSTQRCAATSQRRGATPPSGAGAAQPSSERQPGTQARAAGSQWVAGAQRSLAAVQATQRPEGRSQTGVARVRAVGVGAAGGGDVGRGVGERVGRDVGRRDGEVEGHGGVEAAADDGEAVAGREEGEGDEGPRRAHGATVPRSGGRRNPARRASVPLGTELNW